MVYTMNKHIENLVLSALSLALAYILPFITGNIPQIGSMLLPMHIPVLICGFLCGAPWGLAVGLVAPIMRSLLTGGFPPMFPTAAAMAFELAAYGFVAGFIYRRLPKKLLSCYIALVSAMLCGRAVWGLVMSLLLMNADGFTFAAFIAGAFTNAIPGILLQLLVIPPVVVAMRKFSFLPGEV